MPTIAELLGPRPSEASPKVSDLLGPRPTPVPSPQDVLERYKNPTVGDPSYAEAKSVYDYQQKRPLLDKVAGGLGAAGYGALQAGKQFLGSAYRGATQEIPEELSKYPTEREARDKLLAGMSNEEQEKYLEQHPNPAQKLVNSAGDAAVRTFKGLYALGQKAYNKTADYFSPADPAAQLQARWSADLQRQRELAQKPGLVDENQIYPNVAEAGSYLYSPPGLGAASKLFGKAGKAEVAGAGAASRLAGKAGDVAEAARAALLKPANKVADAERGLLGDTAAFSGALRTSVAAPVAAAKGVQKVAENAEQLGRTVGDSRFTRAEQVAMSPTAPQKGLAVSNPVVGRAIQGVENTGKAAVKGAAINAALAAPGAENPEELGQATGSGASIAGITHLMVSPAASAHQREVATQQDFERWISTRTPEEHAALSQYAGSDKALKNAMDADVLLNGMLDKTSNVKFKIVSPEEMAAEGGGTAAGAAFDHSGQPTILLNAAKMQDGTAFEEAFHHLIRSPEIVDYADLSRKLFGVYDDKGNMLQQGAVGPEEVKKFGDQYWNRLDESQKKEFLARGIDPTIAKDNPYAPEAKPWRDFVYTEMATDFMGRLSAETEGSVLMKAKDPIDKLLHETWIGGVMKKLGSNLADRLGITKIDDIPDPVKSNREVYSLLKEYLRTKMEKVPEPSFSQPMIMDSAPKYALKEIQKDAGLVGKFGHLEYFKRNPDGTPMTLNGEPVLMTPREIKRLDRERNSAFKQVLETIPFDTDPNGGGLKPAGKALVLSTPEGGASVPRRAATHWAGPYATPEQAQAFQNLPDHLVTPFEKQVFGQVNQGLMRQDGSTFLVGYTGQTVGGKTAKTVSESVRPIAPLSLHVSTEGGRYFKGLDVRALYTKMQRFASANPEFFDAFGGSRTVFLEKLHQYLDNHARGLPGDTGLDTDPVKARQMKIRLNDMVNIRDLASEENNPERYSGRTYKDQLIKSFRLDRITKIDALPDKYPVDVELNKMMYSPQNSVGAPQ